MSTLTLTIRPEFFRLPARGPDPYFGLSKSYYYSLDATGQVLLVRIRKRGSQKGVVLVNYEAMSVFITKEGDRSAKPKEIAPEPQPNISPPSSGNTYRIIQRYPEETELMRKLTPTLFHDLLKTIADLEQMVKAAPRGY